MEVHDLTYGLANLAGYLVGLPRYYLDAASRKSTPVNYSYCSSVEDLRNLRTLFSLRHSIVADLREPEVYFCAMYDKASNPRAQAKELGIFNQVGTNPRARDVLNCVCGRIDTALSSELFRKLCGSVEVVKQLRWLFTFDLSTDTARRCDAIRTALAKAPRTRLVRILHPNMFLDDQTLLEVLSRHYIDAEPSEIFTITAYQGSHSEQAITIACAKGEPLVWLEETDQGSKSSVDPNGFRPSDAVLARKNEHKVFVDWQSLDRFCKSHSEVLIEVDSENMSCDSVVGVVKFVEQRSSCSVIVHGRELAPQYLEALQCGVGSPVQYLNADSVVQRKNTVDTRLIASAVYEANKYPERGLIIVSSDSDYYALTDVVPAEHLCFCYKSGITSSGYIEALKSIGCAVVDACCALAEITEEVVQKEYFLGVLTSVLPCLRDYYDNVHTISYKPSFEELCFSVGDDGKISVALK